MRSPVRSRQGRLLFGGLSCLLDQQFFCLFDIIFRFHPCTALDAHDAAKHLRKTLNKQQDPGTTGENLHVDAGYHVVGMKAVDAPDIDVVTGRKE